MQGLDNYQNGTKETWRGWKWNCIANAAVQFNERLPPSERTRRLREKTVLYLVGPDDVDRRKAISKGFSNHNLIAVDISQDRIDEVRAAGGIGICAPLQQILRQWPRDWPIDVIDADLCSGFVSDVRAIMHCLFANPAIHKDSVISMNLMRGRDEHSNGLRELCRAVSAIVKMDPDSFVKHRGFNWLMNIPFHVFRVEAEILRSKGHAAPCSRENIAIDLRRVNEFFRTWNPKVSTYKSKGSSQYFDSVVHRWGLGSWINWIGEKVEFDDDVLNDIKDVGNQFLSRKCANETGVRERISALRAVRTKHIQKSS